VLSNSYVFILAFLPLTLLAWWTIRGHRARLVALTLASYLFYGWWDYRFIPLMVLSTTADYLAGLRIHRSESSRARKTWLVALLVFNLGILAIFKYYGFFIDSLNGLAHALGADPSFPALRIVLPIGISFYTFNSISYTIDIYRRQLRPTRSLLEFSTFVALFPHLVAGPIVRYADMDEQFEALPRRLDPSFAATGIWLIVIGMVKKTLIADVMAAGFVTPLFATIGALGFVQAWIAALAYTAQIYFDFSAYSDMAVGLALLLGFRFPQNFDSPYKSVNISEFWRRWHMSLSFWLRDYLFIPLGGSRDGALRTLRNLMITMFLGGLWHGASWTFAAWGLYHGALLAGHGVLRARGWVPRSRSLSTALTFVSVVVGWVLFRAQSFGDATRVLGAMSGLFGRGALPAAGTGALRLTLLAGALGLTFLAPNTWQLSFPRSRAAAVVAALAMFACFLRFAAPSPFLYFQF
jgi:alginate O-acetyltransferase complex protein AlgI